MILVAVSSKYITTISIFFFLFFLGQRTTEAQSFWWPIEWGLFDARGESGPHWNCHLWQRTARQFAADNRHSIYISTVCSWGLFSTLKFLLYVPYVGPVGQCISMYWWTGIHTGTYNMNFIVLCFTGLNWFLGHLGPPYTMAKTELLYLKNVGA